MPPATFPANRTLEVRNVSKYFGDHAALQGVSLRLSPGDSVLLYGPNGAGKTTLLRTLAALSRPSQGEVLFDGQSLHRSSAGSKAAIGYVSHATLLYPDLSTRENLKFTGKLFGLDDLEKKIDTALDLFAIRDRASEPVRNLSRGLQQRAALARAFLHQPAFLLLDEPFTGLDAENAQNLECLLRRLPAEGKGLVFSTHGFALGASIARRLVALERSRVRYDGPLSLAPLEALGITESSTQ